MAHSLTHMGPYTLDHRIHTSEDRTLFYAPRPAGTRIPFGAAIYSLHHTHRQTEHILELEDDFQLLQRLNHPAFPKPIQLYEGQFGFAREWIEGASLRELLTMIHQSKTLLPQDSIYEIMAQIIDGYVYIQQQTPPLIHGRLSWDHIILSIHGQVGIIGLRTHRNDAPLSFSSPEQATETFFDWRSDQWSIGAIFASLLLKESLYTGRPNPKYDASKGDVTHWLDRIKVGYPDAYPIVAKMLHYAAGERYKHPTFMTRDIKRLQERFPNSQTHELGIALGQWMQETPQEPTQSIDSIIPRRVLPIKEPQHATVLEVTEQIEPELDSLIEVTQFNVPRLSAQQLSTALLNTVQEPRFAPDDPILKVEIPSKSVSNKNERKGNSKKRIKANESDHTDIIKRFPSSTEQKNTPKTPSVSTEQTQAPVFTEVVIDQSIDQSIDSVPNQEIPDSQPADVSNYALSLSEAAMIKEVFAAQQRAVLLMALNAVCLLIFIWQVIL